MANGAPPLLGRLAVHLKMITMDQLAEALGAQGRAGEQANLGDLLVERGFIDRAQLAKLTAAQRQVIAKQREKMRGAKAVPRKPEPPPVSESPAPEPAPEAAAPEVAARARPAQPAAPKSAEPAPKAAAAKQAAPKPVALAEDDDALKDALAISVGGDADRERFFALLRSAIERGASDVHLHPGSALKIRIGGRLEEAGDGALESESIERMLASILDDAQRDRLARHGEIDVCHTVEGVGRFRANFYREQRGFDGVLRFISATPPTLEELGLPARLAKFTTYHQGMVLVTGPSGCGKSSTMAALVNLINEERREHILTIEDPIEFVHPSKRCLVNQRSAGTHTESFPRALRAALREDPDVIAIGELRDLETVSLALSAAETGHFVLATLHTDNAIRTVNRMVGSFPADQQDQVRAMLSESLRGVISQRLLPRADGNGRIPALETMVVTRAIGNLIRENKTFQIHSILQTGASQGMGLLDHSIRELVKSGAVSAEEAARHVEDPKALAG